MANSSVFRYPRTVMMSGVLSVIGGFGFVLVAADCTAVIRPAQADVYAEDVVYVENAPPRYESSPRESYGGFDVYLVGGQWYRRTGDRWQSYRTEPVELGRRRVEIERRSRNQAPPAQHGHQAPPAQHGHQAPPAHQDRR